MHLRNAGETQRGADRRESGYAPGGDATAGRHRYAAVDLGTHNCRLMIAEAGADRRPHVVDTLSMAPRLGEGMVASGRLGEAAMARAMSSLDQCARRMRAAGVRESRAVATEACRRAANGAAFLARVRQETGIGLRAISSDEESRLMLAGCEPLLDPGQPRALLFDIGGGSTEVVWAAQEPGRPASALDVISLPLGVVTLGERLGTGHVAADALTTAIDDITEQLRPFDALHAIGGELARGGVQMLGTSGTVTTLAAVVLGLRRYRRARIDGIDMPFQDLALLARRLAGCDPQERAAVPCVGIDRADLMVAGCAILCAIHRLWPAASLRIADRGVREGLIFHMLDRLRQPNDTVRETALTSAASPDRRDVEHAEAGGSRP